MLMHSAEFSETYSCYKAVEWLSLLSVLHRYWTKIIAKPDSWFDFCMSRHCVHLKHTHAHHTSTGVLTKEQCINKRCIDIWKW